MFISLIKNHIESTKSIKQLLCLICIVVTSILPAQSTSIKNKWKFEQISTSEGLPSSMVHKVYQDRDGYIWIASFYGLFQYNGVEVKTFKSNLYHPGLLINNNVVCIEEDLSHRLWIGTHEGLCMLDKTTGKITNCPISNIEKQRVNSIHTDTKGRIWFGYIRGFAYYDENSKCPVLLNKDNALGDVPEKINIQSIIEDESGDLLIGTWRQGLYRYCVEDNKFIHYPPLSEDNIILSIYQDSRGTIWLGTNGQGIVKAIFSADRETVSYVKPCGWNDGNDTVYSICEDLRTHSIWLGTRSGLCIMDSDKEELTSRFHESETSNYLPVHEVNSVYRDCNGLMWVGTKGAGVFHINTSTPFFELFYPKERTGKSSNDLVSTLYVEQNGSFWLGSGYGVGYYSDDKHISLCPDLRPYNISYSSVLNQILITIHDEGIWACQDGVVKQKYTKENSDFLPHNLVYQVHEDNLGNWWICSYKGLSVHYNDGRSFCAVNMQNVDSLLIQETTCILEDNDGSLWLATINNGIVHLTGNLQDPSTWKSKNYSYENGLLPINSPLCFNLDKSGRIWVGTEGCGLCLYDNQKDAFYSVHQQLQLPGDMVASIQEDDKGCLWLGTNAGLACLQISGKQKDKVRIFTVADGLSDNFFNQNSSFRLKDTLYFGSSRGVIKFNPENIIEQAGEVPLCVTDIVLDGTSLMTIPDEERNIISPHTPEFTESIKIPHHYNHLMFRFAALSFHHPRKNRYAYRMNGLEQDWHYTNHPEANYTKLPAGDYIFEIKASNENGGWGTVKQIKVKQIPSFWETGWAYIIYFGIIALLSFLSILEVKRRLRIRNMQFVQKGETDKVHQLKLQLFTDISSEEEIFLQSAVACVNRHLDDTEFDVPLFVDEMATSRTTLHHRLKSLTGLNTTSFVRSIRLKAACTILNENPNIRVSDLAYRVGFNDPKYFSLCFKREFGVLPTDYFEGGKNKK